MGIFDKACPQCTATNSAGAMQCLCGYLFDSTDGDESKTSPELVAHEERLFEEYLRARVVQAIEAAKIAAHAAGLEPASDSKAAEALRTRQAIEAAKAELATQRVKVAHAADAARGKGKQSAATLLSRKRNRVARGAMVSPAATSVPGLEATEATNDEDLYNEYLAVRAAQAAKRAQTKGATVSQTRAMQRKTAGKVFRAAQGAKAAEAIKPAPGAAIEPANSMKAEEATNATRAAKAAKAELNAQRMRIARATDSMERKQSRYPEETFRTAQAAKIARAVEAARALDSAKGGGRAVEVDALGSAMDCPLCTAILPADATRCACGWLVPAAQREIPTLLATEEHSADALETLDCPIECPACSASIPAGASRCGCGWLVPKGEREMPPLALSAEERAAIAQCADIKRPR